MRYDKPALSFEQQLDLLISRGLVVDDRTRALHYLGHINYYRLAGYVLPFEADHATHALKPGTRFDQVLDLYIFDRELRLLLMDAIERIEVSVRTRWAYELACATTPHGYLERAHACSSKRFAGELATLAREVDRSQEIFIAHNRSKYTEPDLPPVWVACEVMSLGQLSRWYALLRPLALRKKIARPYGFDQQVFESALHHLSYVRNVCAHHARLWNRDCVVELKLPRKASAALVAALSDTSTRRIYNSLCLIAYLMDCINPGHAWRDRVCRLIERHEVDVRGMGMPEGWQERAFWAREDAQESDG